MKLRFIIYLGVLGMLLSMLVGFAVLHLSKHAETGACYRNGSMLSAEELRAKTIRSLLTATMEESARENVGQIWIKTFLIRKSLTSADVIAAITSKSIINLPKEAVYPLNTDSDVANVDSAFLEGEFSIVQFGAGDVWITPSRSIEVVDPDVARKMLDSARKVGFNLSIVERALGYGNHYFRVKVFRHISLACCEEVYSKHPRDGKPQEWYAKQSIDAIMTGQMPHPSFLVVSNCGDLLHRSADDYVWYHF